MTADVLAARQGDPDAFTRLVRAQANAVCAIAVAITQDVRASEEVAQDVFVAAWRGLAQLRNPESFRPWLHQLTRNRAQDWLRQRARRREVDGLSDLVDPADPEAAAADAEREEAVLAALEELPPEHREVLVLFYREGSSVRHVAELLELTEPTVRKRLSRARERLRADVLHRLGGALRDTAPGAAFVASVTIALAAPGTAQAASVAGGGAIGALGGAGLGGALGLGGVWGGYAAAAAHVDGDERAALRRAAWAQTVALLVSVALVVAAPSLPTVIFVMVGLIAAMAGSLWRTRTGRRPNAVAGLVAGATAGVLGAAVGVSAAGGGAFEVVGAQLLQAVSYLALPIALFVAVPVALDVRGRWLALGGLTWALCWPALVVAPFVAWSATGSPLASVAALSVCAGVLEESGRWLAFRAARRAGPREAVVVGLGHGGVESLILGAQMVAGGLLATEPSAAMFLLSGVARPAILLVHVGLSVLVHRSVAERRPSLLGLAVAAHVGLDLLAFGAPLVWPVGGLVAAGLGIGVATLLAWRTMREAAG